MELFSDFLSGVASPANRARTAEVLSWVAARFPSLAPRVAWNQPMFTDHGTYIIGFSVSARHMAVAPERAALDHFTDEIAQSGYERTKELIRIPWDKPVDFALLERIIAFNIADKAGCTGFWRK